MKSESKDFTLAIICAAIFGVIGFIFGNFVAREDNNKMYDLEDKNEELVAEISDLKEIIRKRGSDYKSETSRQKKSSTEVKSSKRTEQGKKNSFSRDAKWRNHPVSLVKSARVGNVKIMTEMILLKVVHGVKTDIFGGETKVFSKEKMFVLFCNFTNVSQGQVFKPVTRETIRACYIEDNFGNKMEAFVEGLFETDKYVFENQVIGKEIKPGENFLTKIICYGPKVENATSYTWTVYFISDNEMSFNQFSPPKDSFIKLKFNTSQITKIE